MLHSVLQSSPVAGEPVSAPNGHPKECAYELAKDFGTLPKKDTETDPVYTVPFSNIRVSHVGTQQILFKVSEYILSVFVLKIRSIG